MRCRYTFLSFFSPSAFLSNVDSRFLSPCPASSTSLLLQEIDPKATSAGKQRNYSVQAAGNFSKQLVGDVLVKRRSVAGVDQEELLDPEKLAEPDSLFTEFNGVRIHHKICQLDADEEEKEGAFRGKIGLPMILLHGFGASVFSWAKIMKPLARLIGSKVLAFDRPAFGLTSRASNIMKKEGKGGAVEKMKKEGDGDLDLGEVENPFTRIWRGFCMFWGIIAGFILQILSGMASIVSSLFAKLVVAVFRSAFAIMLVRVIMDKFGILTIRKSWYDASQITDDVIKGYTMPLRAKGWDSALLEFAIAMLIGSASKPKPKPSFSKRLSEIKCPVLIVTGDTDLIVPSWNARRLAQAIPGSTLEIIRKCGHLPHEEKPDEFLSAIENFLYTTFGARDRQFTEVTA